MNNTSLKKQELINSLEAEKMFNAFMRKMHESENFVSILPAVEKELLTFLRAERMTIYRRTTNELEIISLYKSGNELKEIRLPISATSIAGFVALSHKPLCINNVHDSKELKSINPNLEFNSEFDRKSGFHTRSMIVIPIKFKSTLLGVLQLINKIKESPFNQDDLNNAVEFAQIIGQKLHYDVRSTSWPFDYLIKKNLITVEVLEIYKKRAAKENITVNKLFMQEAKIPADEILKSLSLFYQVPSMTYDPEIIVPEEIIKKLNKSYLRNNRWVPVLGDKKNVVVLIDDPNDFNRIMEIQQVINAETYEFRVGLAEDILKYIDGDIPTIIIPGKELDLKSIMGRINEEKLEEKIEEKNVSGIATEDEAMVIQLVNGLIKKALEVNASDIHVEPGKEKENAIVRFRVDGVCRQDLEIPASHIRPVIARIKILANLDIAERRLPQDGKIAINVSGKRLELRVATLPTVNGEGAVLRLLASGEALPFDKLNLSAYNAENVKRLIDSPHGLFLVVGPTGSGKTTTLHAVLGHINTPDQKIWTAEDPVEITQKGLQQVQIQSKIKLDFATVLRAFLRADPDVILIGEMRDYETAHIGIEASLTGHLVFSTLHTNSASETIIRLLDMGLDPFNFADSLLGVLAQRLVRTLCKNCKTQYTASEEEVKQLAYFYGDDKLFSKIKTSPVSLWRAEGCDQCGKTGYRGRTGIHELLLGSIDIKHVIATKSQVAEIRKVAIEQGMTTLMQDGIAKILKGDTDLSQLRQVAS